MSYEAGAPKSMNGAVLRARAHVSLNDFRSVFRSMWRRRWLPVAFLLAGATVGLALMVLTPPVYSASARIMIDAGDNQSGALQSEVEIAESLPVLSKVAGTLGLYRDPRFRKPDVLERLGPDADAENALRERVLGRLRRMVDVRAIAGTSIIDMTVRHPNPDRAAQIANVLLTAYQERKVDERFEQSRRMGQWLSQKLEDIRGQADAAKGKLDDFRATHGIVTQGGMDVKALRIQSLNQEIAKLQDDLSGLRAKPEASATARSVHTPDYALQRRKLADLQDTLADLRERYGDKHPKVLQVMREITEARAKLQRPATVKTTVSGVRAIESRIADLQGEVGAMAREYSGDSKLEMEYRALQSQVATTERLYENMVLGYQDMMAKAELQGAGFKVVSMATIPSVPDYAKPVRRIGVLAFAGLAIGFLLVLARVLWNATFTSADQLETLTGYPVFATVPAATGDGNGAVHHTVTERPAAILTEALRSLRVALRLRAQGGLRPRVVALTSTLPDEGKTSLAVMLAMVAAKSGERVCVVDCDLRKPSLHKAFGVGNARGLQDYLSDRLSLDEAVYRKDPSGVHLMTTKAVPSYSLTLLTSGRMERLIELLREQYDLVILDAPSSLAFADARVLSSLVDQTLYVVSWGRTRRESAMASLKAYADMGCSNLALVLNKVDMREYLREGASSVIYQYGADVQGVAVAEPA